MGMVEFFTFVIGLLMGVISMCPVFPDNKTFWGWIFKRGKK